MPVGESRLLILVIILSLKPPSLALFGGGELEGAGAKSQPAAIYPKESADPGYARDDVFMLISR